MVRSTIVFLARVVVPLGMVALAFYLAWVWFAPRPHTDAKLVELASKAVDVADEARHNELDSVAAAHQWHVVGIVLAAGTPLLVAYLVLRECCRREPQTEEVVSVVSRLMASEHRRRLAAGSRTAELPEAEANEL